AASYRGAFASFTLPALPDGLVWDSSRLVVDGTLSVVSGAVPTLAVATSPSTQTADVGTTVTLIGGAVGTLPISYQWQFNGSALSGRTGPSILLRAVQKSAQGDYLFIASNGAGSVTSAVATLTVNRPPAAQAQTLVMSWNSSVNISLFGSDPDGDAITF